MCISDRLCDRLKSAASISTLPPHPRSDHCRLWFDSNSPRLLRTVAHGHRCCDPSSSTHMPTAAAACCNGRPSFPPSFFHLCQGFVPCATMFYLCPRLRPPRHLLVHVPGFRSLRRRSPHRPSFCSLCPFHPDFFADLTFSIALDAGGDLPRRLTPADLRSEFHAYMMSCCPTPRSYLCRDTALPFIGYPFAPIN